ncbi:MAG TPA: NAD(P)-dependent oxidoreductase [Bryobacteraceae bacterium]|jgi:3-hydroxyisobutyrate dehydrogenase-like beta-hydroxyacid dehydrogenase|nr:NAD(P)-dependent oxidoreductase [Bryobacteraceae bacterium]
MRIAFIGLGKMGSGIAWNLLEAGHQLTVYNRSPEKTKRFADRGAAVADSPAEACRNCEAALTMLADDQAVEAVVFGKDGIASALPAGAPHISHSTISTAFARRLTSEHEANGQAYLSVPVFGRPEAAENKKLIVVAAGASDLVERFRPLFDAMGRATFVVGAEPWQANAVKLCGNFMIGSMMESFGETFAVMRKAGVDHHAFLDIMNELFGSPVYKNYGGIIADERFSPAGFVLKLGLKDIRLVLQTSDEVTAPMPFASVLRDHLLDALAHGQTDLDWSSVGIVAARNAGLK